MWSPFIGNKSSLFFSNSFLLRNSLEPLAMHKHVVMCLPCLSSGGLQHVDVLAPEHDLPQLISLHFAFLFSCGSPASLPYLWGYCFVFITLKQNESAVSAGNVRPWPQDANTSQRVRTISDFLWLSVAILFPPFASSIHFHTHHRAQAWNNEAQAMRHLSELIFFLHFFFNH